MINPNISNQVIILQTDTLSAINSIVCPVISQVQIIINKAPDWSNFGHLVLFFLYPIPHRGERELLFSSPLPVLSEIEGMGEDESCSYLWQYSEKESKEVD